MRRLPSQDPDDPDYRRLHYVRYADDWLVGFAGPKAEAEEIRARLRAFLREHLKLELSGEKTLVTHAGDKAARFLGYEISGMHADDKRDRRGRRSVNGHVMLQVPRCSAAVFPYERAFLCFYGRVERRVSRRYVFCGEPLR